MSFEILGVGTANPEHAVQQKDAAEIAKHLGRVDEKKQRQIVALYRRSGVQQRYSVLLNSSEDGAENRQSFYTPGEEPGNSGPDTAARMEQYVLHAAPLAIKAANKALLDSGKAPGEITHLVTVSCSGFSAPGFDIELIRELGLPEETARTHVGFMGCHGAMNGLRVAKAYADADPKACVLVCAVELCSVHHHYGWNPQRIVANSLFADGAAAVVGCHRETPTGEDWTIVANGSRLLPDSREMMSWEIGNNGFEMGLSPEVPNVIQQYLPEWMEAWLGRHQLTTKEIASWAIHPGGPRILQATAEALGLDDQQMEPSRRVLEEYGNMSSPTVLFIIERLRQAEAKRPCVILGFGPGLVAEAALIL
ncbi:Alpha-pyrone synthesis polyketide synthase-like Pks18 [Polystyrenella longa]|uniref:Alpha-pyrone synthesis polyketide synthase-like Pks18 n=1 Tax=Polystyrenella longa TaxID=2528007 RepID=A0A518CHA1_9PLAN|nr:type III polyketide synthase [Polystyrenella longa]QDU78600.1 Alpha-pyrone synthesis polyketide synthase-like Pks18 [Polystyrenella longa]